MITRAFLIPLIVLTLALLVDLILGEPPLWIHPTVLMGKVITAGLRVAPSSAELQRAYGVVLALGTISIFAGTAYLILGGAARVVGEATEIILGPFLLKPTFSVRLMYDYALKLASAVRRGDSAEARGVLRQIVRRDPEKLSESQIISAGVESAAESTTDGITSPLFYYALFGIPGAIAYRVVNTLDSIVGYKDPQFIYLGWFSAKLDSVANWLPARLTAMLTIFAAALTKHSASGALQILRRDRNRTESWNAGWTMSAMAGALGVELEKPGAYVLGNRDEELASRHIIEAARILAVNTVLFSILIVLPIIVGVEWASVLIGH